MPDVKHQYVSEQPDDGGPDVVNPSDWNASHTITGTADTIMGFATDGTAEDIMLGPGLTKTGATLDVSEAVIDEALMLAIALG